MKPTTDAARRLLSAVSMAPSTISAARPSRPEVAHQRLREV